MTCIWHWKCTEWKLGFPTLKYRSSELWWGLTRSRRGLLGLQLADAVLLCSPPCRKNVQVLNQVKMDLTQSRRNQCKKQRQYSNTILKSNLLPICHLLQNSSHLKNNSKQTYNLVHSAHGPLVLWPLKVHQWRPSTTRSYLHKGIIPHQTTSIKSKTCTLNTVGAFSAWTWLR
jgi:hypothetical protein